MTALLALLISAAHAAPIYSIDIEDSAGNRALITINYTAGLPDRLLVPKAELDSSAVESIVLQIVRSHTSN